ncbi:MAG: ABC transporter ATP-binding protein [Candidatus Berkelbacteria bacterium]
MTEVIRLEDIKKIYKTGDEEVAAVKNANLIIEKGEFVAITGPSGSGKSTLMHILGLLDKPTSGKYYLDGEDVSKISANDQAEIRNKKIGFVFQQFNLLPKTTVKDNILLPTIYGKINNPNAKVDELLEKVGLKDRAKHLSNQLSGGQIQRVAIARSLIMNPSLIMADEPTGNLDTKKSAEIMKLFREINEQGATIILITHEDNIAKHAKRIIKIIDGEIVSDQKGMK